MIETYIVFGIIGALFLTSQIKKKLKQEEPNQEYIKLTEKLNNIERSLSSNERLIRGNRIEAMKDNQQQNRKIEAYTKTMKRLILLYESLSNSPKPTKKVETESEKIEKITDKLFEELGELDNSKKKNNQGCSFH
jgi:GTPase involved in cell partitioning and DNA repair